MIKEHDQVILNLDFSEQHLKAGDVGTVVQINETDQTCKVEFFTMDGKKLNAITVGTHQIHPMNGNYVLHVRQLSS